MDQRNAVYRPLAAFSDKALFKSMDQYEVMFQSATENPDQFWKELAQQNLKWHQPFNEVLDWRPPIAKWFGGGQLNASVQCLDRFVGTATMQKTALIWEGENEDSARWTYQHLFEEVCRCTNALKQMGVNKDDIVLIYLPMVPEAIVSLLACARIGAAHSVVFAGFSFEAVKDRLQDSKARFVITADGGFRKGQVVPLKSIVDNAIQSGATLVEKVLVVQRSKHHVDMTSGRDIWWHDFIPMQSHLADPVFVDSEHLLFTLYTSGTTGKPKGLMHTTAGYLLWAKLTTQWVFDLKDSDIYWCTADIGWITGHSYLVYGPLQNGATIFMYEGAPNFPDWGRFWKMIAKYKITILYTAPTAIRAFMSQGDNLPQSYDLTSLRLLGSVGEPINPEAWSWYHKIIGNGRCPIVDTWWQTETGGILISPLPGATPLKPGSCSLPLPGIQAKVLKKDSSASAADEAGFLVISHPWPSMARGIFGDSDRFQKTYFADFPGSYFTGDGAKIDSDGYFWVIGRVDDVINVSGHRLGTAEIESALITHPLVAESAVVGRPDQIKGQAIVAFVVLSDGDHTAVVKDLKDHVAKEIGALARPEEIRIIKNLPKTRSGKIMRRLLREIAVNGMIKGDLTTLEDSDLLLSLTESSSDDEG